MAEKGTLAEVAKVFFKMGCFAFGGPAAHIAMMEKEIIEKRKWMTHEHFLDLIGATNLIPGPNSTEMTMHCGHERAGSVGLFVAGICFIFPAILITGFFAWIYKEYGDLPNVEPFIYGIKPAVLAIILGAILKLGKKALKSFELGVLGALALTSALLGVNEIVALLGTGLLGVVYFQIKNAASNTKANWLPLILLQSPTLAASSIPTWKVFLTFLKVGSVLYGSGYVLFAYLDAELVTNGWLTRQELIDAVAVGQFTPGPVLSTATFIGFQLNGFWGAIASTAGIFLPSFLFVLLLNPLVPKMRQSKILSYFLSSVNVAAVAVMVSVLFEMGRDTLVAIPAVIICALSLIVTFGFKKVSPIWIIIGASILGYAFTFIPI